MWVILMRLAVVGKVTESYPGEFLWIALIGMRVAKLLRHPRDRLYHLTTASVRLVT